LEYTPEYSKILQSPLDNFGSALHDNARKIYEVRQAMATYRTTANPNYPLMCAADHAIFKLVLLLDDYPAEMTWQVVYAAGSQVGSGGPYDWDTQRGEAIVYKECLPDATHVFTISNTRDDGICCGYGQGSYKIYWSGALVASGGAYLGPDSHTFGHSVNYAGWLGADGYGCKWYDEYASRMPILG
jgi:hypothetical protein